MLPFRRRPLQLFVLTAALALPVGAASSPAVDPRDPALTPSQRLDALVERVKLEQSRVETLEADFVQERSSEFLERPETSHGKLFYSRPDRVRWEYLKPNPISLVIEGDEMLTWYRDLGTAEKVKVGRVSSQVFRYLDAAGSLEALMDYFAVTMSTPEPGAAWRLVLEPRYPRIAKRLSGITLWIDPDLYLPIRVRYTEPNGDSTEYRFDSLRANVPIPEERFRLALPQEVAVRVLDLAGGRVTAH